MANDKKNMILGASLGTELGGAGTWISGGFITHEEYNQKLIWRRGIDIFDRMRKSDGSIQAMLKVCKHPLLAATYDIEPASDEEFDQYVARFCKAQLFDVNVNWYQFLRDALGKLEFGFSVFEKTYEPTTFEDQYRIGIKSLGWRKQWSVLRWETEDNQPGITQQLMVGTVSIPENKILLFVNDREGDNYQGVSLLRYVYKDWDIKHRVENLMAVAAERSLGVPVFEHKAGISEKEHKKIEEILKNFRASEKGYMLFEMGKGTLTFPEIKTNITKDYIPILEYLQHEIDKSILAQFLDLAGSRSGGSSGSHALSADQSQLFEKALEAVINEIVGVINEDLIQQMCDLNFSELPNGYPKLTFSNIGDQDLATKGEFANKLAAMDLLTPDRDMENMLRQWADLPDLPDDIYENYADRVTAQTSAMPLTPLGAGQDPNTPAPTGQPIKNPPTTETPKNKPGTKPPGDQTNRVTRNNRAKDNANKPTPVATVGYKASLQGGQLAARDIPNLYDDIDIDLDDLGCIMLKTVPLEVTGVVPNSQGDIAKDVTMDRSSIPGEAIPHITLLYGLLENGNIWKSKVDAVLANWSIDRIHIDQVSYFELPDSYAIVALVEKTTNLVEAHDRLALLPHVNTFTEYKPHITLAYINKNADLGKWITFLGSRYNNTDVKTTGIDYGDMPGTKATEDLRSYRNSLIAAVMADEDD